ncbi:MAG: aspartyl/glutamyl-tRNA amidotransferase subunit C [Candidatus Berkelbacteria bacterium Athens1014_28]|uniref:Aspartyl/glutamyl-tRNA(Asn/Gln) amidotransferase subunit C n=1 Tax=Candidatus Berkelbacteria bacterium Athens1014_28 TaxID=2017145 RepID=A0A554LM72_9BACT|nr:MAG: aspartyl/glutamyl-tRNA amidotransferase subunit C [Candidatus Berkelbacteria bacterium Athens1014_28]
MKNNEEKNQWVLDVARLSRIELTSAEVEKFSVQLKSILDYVAELNEVDTSGAEVTAQVTGLSDVFVDDKIKPNEISWQEIEKNASDFQEGSFKVPAVFE